MTKKRKYTIQRSAIAIILFITTVNFSYAQNKDCVKDCSCEITGTILDQSDKKPIAFASVSIKGNAKGTVSNENGFFRISGLCSDEVDLVISFIGYKSIEHHHDIYHEDPQILLAHEDLILESIVVEGTKIESGLTSITESKLDAQELENLNTETFGDVLRSFTGVATIKTGQNVVKPVIHGLHSNRILIINNGLRHENQNWGVEHAPEIDVSLANDITLIKGAASVKYGPDALGGVIIVKPKFPELNNPLRGNFKITGKSNGRSLGSSVSLLKGYDRWAWMVQASGTYQGDLKSPDYYLTNTGTREYSFALGTKYHKKDLDVNFYFSRFNQELGILRGSVTGNLNDLAFALTNEPPEGTQSFSYDINNPHQEAVHQLFKIDGHYNLHSSSIDFQYGFQINQRREFDIRRGTNNSLPAINLELFSHSVDLDWNHPKLGQWSGVIGFQWLYQDNRNIPGTNTIPFIPNFDNTRLGIYFVESRQLGEMTAEVGIRLDAQQTAVRGRDFNNNLFTNDFSYQNVTGTVGMSLPVGPNASFQSNLGTAWRPPNVSELYSFGKHQFILEYGLWRFFENQADVITENERSVPSEVGVKWVNTYSFQNENVALELTGYINVLKNYIYTKPAGVTTTVRGAFPYFIYNQTNALFIGLDASASLSHSKQWESEARVSLLNAKDVKNDQYFVGIPPYELNYNLHYKPQTFWKFRNVQLGLESQYTFKQTRAPRVITVQEINDAKTNDIDLFAADDSDFDFLPPSDGYFLINTHLNFSYNKFDVHFQVKNLLNTSYRDYTDRLRYFSDDVGRNFVLSLKYRL
ncbi:TonB-dependent receptor [Fulvivirgaceae bacterium BMA10]|uniref:TonB-dependent receptor n=1 Tax=Splendidivirga corallicola TaxID=3051826 RepID=A0ABT8KZT8_9BACT|nr:TonB-dependent receptor [Fulvivirgaceae bacterium BMA10]